MPSRREFFIQSGTEIAAAGLVLAGFGVVAIQEHQRQAELAKPPVLPAVAEHYPEIAHLIPTSHDSFKTKMGREITVVNFTQKEVDFEAVKHIYSLTENLIGNQGAYLQADQRIPFTIYQLSPANQTIFIVPENAPRPRWVKAYDSAANTQLPDPLQASGGAITFSDPDKGINMTLISPVDIRTLPSFSRKLADNPTEEMNNAFVTEACQGTIIVAQNKQPDALGQEIVCNSFAYAMTMKRKNIPYAAYTAALQGVSFSQNQTIPPLTFPEAMYNELPGGLTIIR